MTKQDFAQRSSRERRISNEYTFKLENDRIIGLVDGVLDREGQNFYQIEFVCECSDQGCGDSIKMTVEEFKIAHQYDTRFIVVPTHEQLDIEAVMEKHTLYYLVEKNISSKTAKLETAAAVKAAE